MPEREAGNIIISASEIELCCVFLYIYIFKERRRRGGLATRAHLVEILRFTSSYVGCLTIAVVRVVLSQTHYPGHLVPDCRVEKVCFVQFAVHLWLN